MQGTYQWIDNLAELRKDQRYLALLEELRLFKYCSAHTAKIVLQSASMRWSSPRIFNDAMDVARYYDLGFDLDNLVDEAAEIYHKLINQEEEPILKGAKERADGLRMQREVYKRLRARMPLADLIQHARKEMSVVERSLHLENIRWLCYLDVLRILCFTSTPDDLLMWSHYADSHRGVVIEFDPHEFCLNPDIPTFGPVIYQGDSPRAFTREELLAIWTCQEPMPSRQQADQQRVFTKHECWRYEHEWRCARISQDPKERFSTYPFDPSSVKCVYLGVDISEANADDIRLILQSQYPSCRIKRAVVPRRGYSIQFCDDGTQSQTILRPNVYVVGTHDEWHIFVSKTYNFRIEDGCWYLSDDHLWAAFLGYPLDLTDEEAEATIRSINSCGAERGDSVLQIQHPRDTTFRTVHAGPERSDHGGRRFQYILHIVCPESGLMITLSSESELKQEDIEKFSSMIVRTKWIRSLSDPKT